MFEQSCVRVVLYDDLFQHCAKMNPSAAKKVGDYAQKFRKNMHETHFKGSDSNK